MKYLVDTCGWIEWLTNGKLVHAFKTYLLDSKELIIPTLIQYELYKWICRERNSAIALEVIGITETGLVIQLNTNLALYAADIAKQHGLAMADAIIYATALNNNATVVTADSHFKDLSNVKYFEK
jgi:predicted nucleic acid-binding protein